MIHVVSGAPVDDVTVAGTRYHGNDRRQRVRDGGNRRRTSPARQRRQLSANKLERRLQTVTNKIQIRRVSRRHCTL